MSDDGTKRNKNNIWSSVSQMKNTLYQSSVTGLSSYFQGMFPHTPSYASNNYFFNMPVCESVNQLSICLSYFH